mgnify:CR=1 FL=1
MHCQFIENDYICNKLNSKLLQMKIIKEEIDKMSKNDRIKLMENWPASEVTDYLCPNGTMSIEEFRKYAYEITED